jgi:hypothetical protein
MQEAVTMEAMAQRSDGADRHEARGTVQLDFPHRERAERRHTGGESSFGCFVALPALLAGNTGYEIRVTGIPEGVMAVSAWLQEADDGVPMVAAARFQTEGVALDVRRGEVRVLGRHDFQAWPLPAGLLLILHW